MMKIGLSFWLLNCFKDTVKEKWNENSYIYAIVYKSCSIKQIIFNKYETNLKNDDIPQEPESENLRFSPIIILKFGFCILNRYNR